MDVKISIEKKTNFFEKYPDKALAAISEAIKKGCLSIEASAKQNCPVDTGNLRASITTNIIDDTSGEVGTNVEYASFVEFGTKKQSAQPFLYPAYKENEEKIVKEIEKALGGK